MGRSRFTAFLFALTWWGIARADVLVGDFNNHQVLRFTDSGALLGVFGDADDRIGLGIPGGIAVRADRHVFVKSMTTGRVIHFDPQGNYLSYFSDLGLAHQGLLFDHAGNLWTRRIGSDDRPGLDSRMVRFAANGTIALDFGTLRKGMAPFAFDDQDNIYLPRAGGEIPVDPLDGVFRFTPDGVPLGAFGDATQPRSGCNSPDGVAFDSVGQLYVPSDGRILRYARDGAFLGVFATSDVAGYLLIDPFDNLFVGDGSQKGVRKFDRQGNYLGKIISAGVGGVPANFRNEAIAYLPPVPEPTGLALAVAGFAAFRRRRAQE